MLIDMLQQKSWPVLVLLFTSLTFVSLIVSIVIATVAVWMFEGSEVLLSWLRSLHVDKHAFKLIYFLNRFFRRRFTKRSTTVKGSGLGFSHGELTSEARALREAVQLQNFENRVKHFKREIVRNRRRFNI